MHGAGTRQDITTSSARCLDVTRLLRRAGRVPTGVDRVELAYLRQLVDEPVAFYALARTRLGYVLLDREGAREFLHAIETGQFDALDGLGRIAFQRPLAERQAEATVRRLALARCLPIRLSRMLRRHLPEGAIYLNTGHSNLTNRVISTWRTMRGARIVALVHDTIPLDYPEYQRPETRASFAAFLKRVARFGDLVIYNSAQSQADAERHMQGFGRVPDGVVVHLGVEPMPPRPEDLPAGMPPNAPYFVAVGTIEPRKNHALLLDLWERFAKEPEGKPHLVICGARGWRNDAVFARLDDHERWNGLVHEAPGLTDGAIAALLTQSNGLLFPSHAEGFGLPPVEAATLGIPVICSDLAVIREIMDDIPIYAESSDTYSWQNIIERVTEQRPKSRDFEPPTWDAHFNVVLRRV